MVKLIANSAVNTQKLTELSLLSDFSDMNIQQRKHSSFTAIDDDAGVKFPMTGTAFTYRDKMPITGLVETIAVRSDGEQLYQLKKLSINVRKMDKSFKGSTPDLMEELFSEKDKLIGSDEDDVLYSYNRKDTIKGNDGGDLINGGKGTDTLKGGNGEDEIYGAKGHDMLFGGNDDDQLFGGSAADTLDGGLGNDILTGGKGFDTFVFDTALSATNNVDTITDMTPGGDAIDLSKSIFNALPGKGVLKKSAFEIGSSASSTDVRIVYDDSDGKLYYDADGSGSADQIQFATLSTGLSLSNTDFFVIA